MSPLFDNGVTIVIRTIESLIIIQLQLFYYIFANVLLVISLVGGNWVVRRGTIYIYFPCIREIWRCVHSRKVIFPEGNMTISRVNKFSYLPYAREISGFFFHQANVLVNSAKLLFRNISGVIRLYNRNYSAILATLQITSYVHSRNSS